MAASSTDAVYDFGVALQAGGLRDVEIALRDIDLIREAAGSKSERMKESVQGLRSIFGEKPRRRMAIVAYGRFAMARLQPTGMLLAHDVAIGASGRVIGQIRGALGIPKGKHTNADQDARDNGEQQWGRDKPVLQTAQAFPLFYGILLKYGWIQLNKISEWAKEFTRLEIKIGLPHTRANRAPAQV